MRAICPKHAGMIGVASCPDCTIESLRQQLAEVTKTLDETAPWRELQAENKAMKQQLAECEQQRDSNYDEMQRALAELKESIRERNAFQDQCISLKMKMTVMREERDMLVEILSDAVRDDDGWLSKAIQALAAVEKTK